MWKDTMPKGDLFNFERFFGLCFFFAASNTAADHLAHSPKWVAANRAWAMHVDKKERDNPTRDYMTVLI